MFDSSLNLRTQSQVPLIWFQDMPNLDFERYLQPSLRCSLSPAEAVAMEMLSPMATPTSMAPDVEMESPEGQSESQAQQETGTIGRSRILLFERLRESKTRKCTSSKDAASSFEAV